MSINIIDTVEIDKLEEKANKINKFHITIKKLLKKDVDFGIIPAVGSKPTLLKPGAEKILLLLGLTSRFEIITNNENYQDGFFSYQIKCTIFKDNEIVAEGFGSANTAESKFRKKCAYTNNNTILKIAKKRALVDSVLLVASLSELFTQDIEDLDNLEVTEVDKITEDEAKKLFKIANGRHEVVRNAISEYKVNSTKDILKKDYYKIIKSIKLQCQS